VIVSWPFKNIFLDFFFEKHTFKSNNQKSGYFFFPEFSVFFLYYYYYFSFCYVLPLWQGSDYCINFRSSCKFSKPAAFLGKCGHSIPSPYICQLFNFQLLLHFLIFLEVNSFRMWKLAAKGYIQQR
jgi:hypothetical protein